jgi:hypothetical protein
MNILEIKYLIVTLIGIDIVFLYFFIVLIKRLNNLKGNQTFEKETQIFESLIKDAGKMEGQFVNQLKAKSQLVNELNEQLDSRIDSLNVLLNRSSVLLSSYDDPENSDKGLMESSSRRSEILALAADGHDITEISKKLSIPKGEVTLILNMNKTTNRLNNKKGVN